MINSNSVFKIIELKKPCGISQDITGEYPINDFKNICLTQLSDNSKIESLTIKRNGSNIFQHRYLYNYIYDYLNFCSENQNKNLNIGDTLKVEFSISDYSNYKCWIDLNNNNTFDVNEEISSSDTNSLYKNFHTFRYVIPQNLPLNEYRLRLTTKKNEIVNSPCGRSTSIDFCFTVIPNPEPKITNINVNNNNLSVCSGSLIDIEIDTLGKFENNNIFKLYLSNSNGKFEDSKLIGQSNLRSFQSAIPNIEIGNEFRYRLMVTSSNPKVSFELSQDLIVNKTPYLNLKDTTFFIVSYSDTHEVYVKNAGSIPLNFTTNSGYSGSIPNSYSVIRVPISNINEIFFTQLSNSCGTTQSEGKIFLKKYNPYDFKVKLYDKMGLVSTFNNSNFHQGEFNLHQLADSMNIKLEIPENIGSYSIKGFAGLNVTRSGRIVQNDFYLFQNFIAKGLKSYSFIVELFGDIDQKILINKYEYSFSIVESKAPCKTYIFDCTINPNDYINNFYVFDRSNSKILDFESSGCNKKTSYYGSSNLIYKYTNFPIFETSRKYSFKVTSGGNNSNQHFYIFIDYDNSGDFSSTELVYVSTQSVFLKDSLKGEFFVPNSIRNGKYFMRILSRTTNENGEFINNYPACLSPINSESSSNEINDFFIEVKNPVCVNDLQLISDINGNFNYEANTSVKIKSAILNNSKLSIDSGKYILLEPGFETKSNVVFSTLIDGCGNN